jgi:hypothetical protein
MLCLDSTLLLLQRERIPPMSGHLAESSLQGGQSTKELLACLNVLMRNSSSPGRHSWLHMALAPCTKVISTDFLLAGWWCTQHPHTD